MELKKGFYPALGTPLDDKGSLVAESFSKQIEMMIDAGAAGVLCMGSMGAEAALTSDTYRDTARVAVETVKGRVPVFIGTMDNSVYRVKERFEMIKDFDFSGIVLTTPFYETSSNESLIEFFKECADAAPKPVFLYDLAVVTKQKITFEMAEELSTHPNIKGIKTGDIVLARKLMLANPDFHVMFSNIDIFDVAGAFGLPKVLDGMFTCTPKNSKEFVKYFETGDVKKAGIYLDKILALRDLMAENGIWPGYTIAMNLLGLAGSYGGGYGVDKPYEGEYEQIKLFMEKIGEI